MITSKIALIAHGHVVELAEDGQFIDVFTVLNDTLLHLTIVLLLSCLLLIITIHFHTG